MLKTKLLQNADPDGSEWPQRLFSQSERSSRNQILNTKNSSTIQFKLGLKHKSHQQHWSNRLFSSAAIGLTPYDKLVVTRNRKTVCEFAFRTHCAEVMIGSHRFADIVLDAAKVSPFHAKISCIDGQYQIEDLGSYQGTYLNGKKLPVKQARELMEGASINIMAYRIRFESQNQQSSQIIVHKATKTVNESCHSPVEKKPNQEGLGSIAPIASNKISPTQIWLKGMTELKVVDVIDETHNVKTFRLAGVTPLSFSYLPGQFITLLLNINGEEVRRSYSMSSSPSRPHTLDLTVKRVPGGLVSNWLCDCLKSDDRLKVKGPAGCFSCLHNPASKVLFIGAGSGVTPLMSMSRWLFDTVSDMDAKVLFSFHNCEDIIYRKELEMMADSTKAIEFAVTLTGKHDNNKNWEGLSGRIDRIMLESFAMDLHQREVFLCGPEPFMNKIKSLLKAINYPMQNLHCESFNTVTVQPKMQTQTSESEIKIDNTALTDKNSPLHTITFAKSNRVLQTDEKTNLLQLAEEQGIQIDYDCRTGSCGECLVKCLEGQAEMQEDCEIDDHEREAGWIFSCCAFARSDLVINA